MALDVLQKKQGETYLSLSAWLNKAVFFSPNIPLWLLTSCSSQSFPFFLMFFPLNLWGRNAALGEDFELPEDDGELFGQRIAHKSEGGHVEKKQGPREIGKIDYKPDESVMRN